MICNIYILEHRKICQKIPIVFLNGSGCWKFKQIKQHMYASNDRSHCNTRNGKSLASRNDLRLSKQTRCLVVQWKPQLFELVWNDASMVVVPSSEDITATLTTKIFTVFYGRKKNPQIYFCCETNQAAVVHCYHCCCI